MSDWESMTLDEIAFIDIGGTPSREIKKYWADLYEEGEPWVSIADLKSRIIYETKEQITHLGSINSNVKKVSAGTLIISFKLSIGRVAIAGRDLYTNEAIAAITPKNSRINPSYLYYILPPAAKNAITDTAVKGSTLNKKSLGELLISFPSLPNHQEQIANIFQTIDQAIELTEALIEKYQQIKAGLMHDLFTRGVTADGKLRPTREHAPELYQETPIGWIPKEWSLTPLGSMAEIVSGVTLGSKTLPDETIEVPYLRVANVQDGYLDLKDIKTVRVNQKTLINLHLQDGDVLMNEGGDFDKLGRGAVWHNEIEPCIHQNHVFRVRTNEVILLPYYLAYWSESNFGKKYFILSSKQSTNLASINSTQLKAYPIARPCIEEQSRIETGIKKVISIIQVLQQEQEKLIKQKSGLMHDLLTGKVPVKVSESEASHA